jgi:[ribosomal protein S5]-alanine N-acetyltransferase
MAYGWEGDKVRLVPLDAEKHLDNAVQWLNDPEVTQWLLIGDLPITKLGEKEWFESRSRASGEDVAMAVETLDGLHIGFSGIHQIKWGDGTGVTGTVLGDKSIWGKGFGADVVKTRSRYAFDVLGLRLLFSGCIDGNVASYKMLCKNGYREYGRAPKKIWKRGAYRDEILMCLSREDWLEAQR